MNDERRFKLKVVFTVFRVTTPPYSKNVSTNIGRIFLKLVRKYFPKHHKFYSIFNKNNIKVSYSCMGNMHAIISKHNKKILYPSSTIPSSKTWNCRIKDHCPLDNNCLSSNIIYNAKIATDNDTIGKNYIGLTEGSFKQRFTQHKLSFNNRKYASSTGLSRYIWRLKDNDEEYNIKWTVITKAPPYSNILKRYDLYLAEKPHIIKANYNTLLNKRSEFISKCRHMNKYLLVNNKTSFMIDQ